MPVFFDANPLVRGEPSKPALPRRLPFPYEVRFSRTRQLRGAIG
jgi:hypothetical protein